MTLHKRCESKDEKVCHHQSNLSAGLKTRLLPALEYFKLYVRNSEIRTRPVAPPPRLSVPFPVKNRDQILTASALSNLRSTKSASTLKSEKGDVLYQPRSMQKREGKAKLNEWRMIKRQNFRQAPGTFPSCQHFLLSYLAKLN